MSVIEVHKVYKKFRDRRKGKKMFSEYGPFMGYFKRLQNRQHFHALRNVSFEVKEGEIFGLLGPNGSGKTTLIKIITGLMKADKGKIKVLGKEVPKELDSIRSEINAVFARAAMFWHLTGEFNLKIYSKIYRIKDAEKKIRKYIKFFELEDKKDMYLDKRSTGELMRFNLARALLNSPSLLFLDEPTIGLDPHISLKVRNFLKKLNKKENLTILLTTHYMEEADYLCDRIAIINKGRIVKIDTPENLKKLLRGECVLELRLKEIDNKIIEKVNKLKYVDNAKWVADEEKLRVLVKNLDRCDDVIKNLRGNKTKILSINTDEPTLEDVFIHLTKERLLK
ncbi:MAG: ABC transporter ATP-binding protein [archaeon]|nr:MAG: ABC transporter ATP-binding protein [archaeon]